MIDAPSWECDAVLSDGAAVHIRTISPDDGPRLVAFHSHLSPDTIYLRFFGLTPVSARPRSSASPTWTATAVWPW